MATTKPPYDPVKTVEGMFNGSVTRIAYAMKDPLNYAQSTKAVLAETAKKFQDALDDCEIQILDAKWYLERQLALNKARREAKAREDSAASAKRKLDEIKDSKDKSQDAVQDHATKRVKTAEPEETGAPAPVPVKPQSSPQATAAVVPKESAKAAPKPSEKPAPSKPIEKPPPAVPADAKRKASVSKEVKGSPPKNTPVAKTKDKPLEPLSVAAPAPTVPPEPLTAQSLMDDYPRATPQDTPAGGNEDFNFVSMFGDPSGTDMMDGTNNDDMGFDMTLGNDFDIDPTAAATAQDSSLASLLPGLETYANQTGDDNGFTLGGLNMNGTVGSAGIDFSMSNQQSQNSVPAPAVSAVDFGLPTLGPNEFDDFLNANDMTFDGAINMEDDGMMNMENMDIDFDSMFK